jgi:Uma2 family endonuclease
MGQPATAALAPLPFELVEDDGEFLETAWHVQQLPLLREALLCTMAEMGRTNDFYIGTNMFVYYSVEQAAEVAREVAENLEPKAFRGPDVFWVGGVARRKRKYWVAWKEGGRLPDLIIELLSPSTARVDRTVKKDLYAGTFRTKEYFLVDPDTLKVEGFELAGRAYQPKVPTAEGRVWSHQLRAYLGFWHGVWMNDEDDWVRLFRSDGSLLPTIAETAEQRARAERLRADTERVRADSERARADSERLRAETAEAELARLRALLDGRAGD